MLDSLKDKSVNKHLDQLMVQKGSQITKPSNYSKTNNHEESKDMGPALGGNSHTDENVSTTLSISRLILFNMEILLNETIIMT